MIDTLVSKGAVMEAVPAASLARRISTEELAVEFLERARADVSGLVGPGGLLAELTKRVNRGWPQRGDDGASRVWAV